MTERYASIWWAREYAYRYLYSCWLYYHADHNEVTQPLDDAAFDNIQQVLFSWWDLTPQWFRDLPHTRHTMKTDAHAITLTPEQQSAAIAWANGFPGKTDAAPIEDAQ